MGCGCKDPGYHTGPRLHYMPGCLQQLKGWRAQPKGVASHQGQQGLKPLRSISAIEQTRSKAKLFVAKASAAAIVNAGYLEFACILTVHFLSETERVLGLGCPPRQENASTHGYVRFCSFHDRFPAASHNETSHNRPSVVRGNDDTNSDSKSLTPAAACWMASAAKRTFSKAWCNTVRPTLRKEALACKQFIIPRHT